MGGITFSVFEGARNGSFKIHPRLIPIDVMAISFQCQIWKSPRNTGRHDGIISTKQMAKRR